MQSLTLLFSGLSVFTIVACGNQSTQFGSAEFNSASYSLSGISADNTKKIKSALEKSNSAVVKIESGMSQEEQLKADAEVRAILSRVLPPSAGKSADASLQAVAEAAAAAHIAAETANAAKAAADATAREAIEAAAQAKSDAEAKAAADAAAKKILEEAAAVLAKAVADAAQAANSSDAGAKETADAAKIEAEQRLKAAEEATASTAKAAAETARKAELEAKESESAKAAANIAAAAAERARLDCAVKKAVKAALEREDAREEEERKSKLASKSNEEIRDDEEDKRDFEEDGEFEVSLPAIVVGDDAGRFLEACAIAMKTDKKNLVIAGAGKGRLKRDQVLVVFANGGNLEVKPDGDKIRGLCVFASAGALVKIPAGKTKINGMYIYERGNNNSIQTSFSSGGKFKRGIIFVSGQKNTASFKGVNDGRCKKLKVYGTPSSVTCSK